MEADNIVPLTRSFRISSEPFSLENQESQTITGRLGVQKGALQGRLVIIAHGLGGSQRQAQIEAAADTFHDCGCNVVTYDATNSFGDSGGDLSKASLTRHAGDLKDVIDFTRSSLKFSGKIVVCGFSLGASAAFLQQINHPGSISAILAFAPVVSGKDWLTTFRSNRPGSFEIMERTGSFSKYDDVTHKSGTISKSFVTDLLTYNFVELAKKISCPSLLVVGSEDKTCTPSSLKRLRNAMSDNTKLEILDGLQHTARNPQDIRLIREFIRGVVSERKAKSSWWAYSGTGRATA